MVSIVDGLTKHENVRYIMGKIWSSTYSELLNAITAGSWPEAFVAVRLATEGKWDFNALLKA